MRGFPAPSESDWGRIGLQVTFQPCPIGPWFLCVGNKLFLLVSASRCSHQSRLASSARRLASKWLGSYIGREGCIYYHAEIVFLIFVWRRRALIIPRVVSGMITAKANPRWCAECLSMAIRKCLWESSGISLGWLFRLCSAKTMGVPGFLGSASNPSEICCVGCRESFRESVCMHKCCMCSTIRWLFHPKEALW